MTTWTRPPFRDLASIWSLDYPSWSLARYLPDPDASHSHRPVGTLQEDVVTEPARWYHLQGETQHGPIGIDEIRALVVDGTVGPETYVWADGMPDWLPARQVPALTPPPELRAELADWR